jgi:hypothetical protein
MTGNLELKLNPATIAIGGIVAVNAIIYGASKVIDYFTESQYQVINQTTETLSGFLKF